MNLWSIRDREPADRVFMSYQEKGYLEIASSIIEQAVEDWKALEYGELNRTIGKPCSDYIYSEDVLSFFQSSWFEHLLSFALPTHSATEVRRALKIPEPRRKRKCVKH